jgi:predicted RNA-binding protein with RPS1 domain
MKLSGDEACWDDVKCAFPIGVMIEGAVFYVAPFGVFVDLDRGGIGLLRVPELAGDNRKSIEDYPPVGAKVIAKVIWHDDRNRQVTLTQRSP